MLRYLAIGTLRHHLLPMVRVDALLPAKISASTRSYSGIELLYPPATGHPPTSPPVVRAEAAHPLGASARF
jgi:hypothetical protein